MDTKELVEAIRELRTSIIADAALQILIMRQEYHPQLSMAMIPRSSINTATSEALLLEGRLKPLLDQVERDVSVQLSNLSAPPHGR